MADAFSDPRQEWLETRVNNALKLNPKKWKALLQNDDNKRPMTNWLERPDERCIFFYLTPKEELCTSFEVPKSKKKVLYFFRINPEKLTVENMRDMLLQGELVAPLDQLYNVCQELYLPVLSNGSNQEGWPEVVSKEVMESFHKFVANTYVTIGQTKGETLLPLPPQELGVDKGNVDKATKDKERVHMLESAVVTWTRQIKNVLKTDPEGPLKAGLNPGPLVELEFWAAKAANLNSIHQQLSSDKIRKVVKVLDVSKSTYFPAFNRLCKEVAQARQEANENVTFLEPLRSWFQKLSQDPDDFTDLIDLFKPVMLTILLIWKTSKFYNSAPRLVVLMREICNDIIMQARNFVSGEDLFNLEPPEAVDRLKTTLKVCGTFKSTYFDYKARAQQECPDNPWRVQNSALFIRMDSFLERCHDILDLMQTIVQFNKLERIEIGGTKGKTLTASVKQVYDDFLSTVATFQNIQYDIMDVSIKEFDDDFYDFRCRIKELERRLGSVLVQGFEDCATVSSMFKLLDSFEGLLEREIIQSDLEKKYADLLKLYDVDLREVQRQFNDCMANPPLYNNMPPIAGSVYWCRGLFERVDEPMEKLKQMSKVVLETEEAKECMKIYNMLSVSIKEFEKTKLDEWGGEVENTSLAKLKNSLLLRDEVTTLLAVNFDPALVRLLREVKYMLLLKLEVPESAMSIYKKSEIFRQQTGNLSLIVNIYNSMMMSLLDVERPLIEKQLNNIDQALEKGIRHLNWKSHGINDFIQNTMSMVKDVNTTLQTLKGNIQKVQDTLDSWSKKPLMERREVKTYTIEEFSAKHDTLTTERHAKIREGGEDVHKLIMSNNKLLKVSKGASSWKYYVDYANQIVIDGMVRVILVSLDFLRCQIDPVNLQRNDISPLLEIRLELVPPNVQYTPDLDGSSGREGVQEMANAWVKGFFHISTLMKRLDTGESDYMKEVEENEEIRASLQVVNDLIDANEDAARDYRDSYLQYGFLWLKDLNQTFDRFLKGKPEPKEKVEGEGEEGEEGEEAEEEPEEQFDEDGKPIKIPEPALDEFDEKIAYYKKLEEDISQRSNTVTFGWLKVDCKPIKQQLMTWISKWTYMYTKHLQDTVTGKLNEMKDFMTTVETGLELPVESGELEQLLEVMGHVRDVRVRTEDYDSCFDPLKNRVTLLKKYAIFMEDNIIQMLEEFPMRWDNVKKQMFNTKERINPFVNMEVERIKGNVLTFGDRVREFRVQFKQNAPFKYSVGRDAAYTLLDDWQVKVTEIEGEAASLNELQELFELIVSDYREIRDCRLELGYLKLCWDMISYVSFMFHDWRRTLWDDIDTEFLTDECKKMQKEMKIMPKQMKGWDTMNGLEDLVKNMIVALPLVNDLHSPAMRERHWKLLMRTTGVHFNMDASFNLGNLIDLKLHQFADDVSTIVDRANKELNIEKALDKIEKVWTGLQLEFGLYKDTDIPMIADTAPIVEALEENQVQLQTIRAGRFVDHFLEDVNRWQGKLGQVEQVLSLWLEVQQRWSSLESIFVGSADIRTQLPEDAKRFDALDTDFKDLMREAPETPNVIDAAHKDGRLDRLERANDGLEKCEKALSDYLDTKRKAFPRFYFVAPADLVDILSKGSDPQAIQKHLPKCFDSLSKLEFSMDDEGKPSKNAISMYSAEMENVPFPTPYACVGAVEEWLAKLVEKMQDALYHSMKDALENFPSAGNAERSWIESYCAQLVVAASRVGWAIDVEQAFAKLEEGNEGAMKEYHQRLIENLTKLITMTGEDLSKEMRKKLVTMITVEVHNRDVIGKLIQEKAENSQAFSWQCQLRYRWDEEVTPNDVFMNIIDAEFKYSYEYIGNCGCLVITPLTDRCYITLTQALRLILGGAPQGPAGTGKTETTKDLGRCLGIIVYVFNCSDQMDYKSVGNIFKGLCAVGAWGCFDEFNRIPVEVLSVCATQWKTCLDAVRARVPRFVFEEEETTLIPSVGAFITMNPGYPGRAELPENLKALFRPCAMCVPDLMMICEIMLASEGFTRSKILAIKFTTLYGLCLELLSKAGHYDWKLRAIKSVLVIAGSLKRADKDLPEDLILMRALRDCNLPKITTADTPIFMGLLSDLFPKLDPPRKRDEDFEGACKHVIEEAGLVPEENFILKMVQLWELYAVRWSVFVIGPTGCGKTSTWRMLGRAQTRMQQIGKWRWGKTLFEFLNPKAVTNNELYGYVNPANREWQDGLISRIFRDFANIPDENPKWIVLDGDIDAEWIESMNTVMDDNKMLTLASNERIPLTGSMRLLLEIADLRNASPATVSRGGVIFVNAGDIGWRPFVDSWIDRRDDKEKQILTELMDVYLTPTLDQIRKNHKFVLPPYYGYSQGLTEINMVMTTCYILDGILPPELVQSQDKALYDMYVQFGVIWGMGGALAIEKMSNHRHSFSEWWKATWKPCLFADDASIYDYFIDDSQKKMMHWSSIRPDYVHGTESVFGNICVQTCDTTCLQYHMERLVNNNRGVCLVGLAGTGKTSIIRDYIKGLGEDYMSFNINLNNNIFANDMQRLIEMPLEKKAGRVYGPPGSKKLIYFIDDLNMPQVNKYFTQTAIQFLMQVMDYKAFYDRKKLTLKEVRDCSFITALNPTAGCFCVNSRCQRHFCTFAVMYPSGEDLETMFTSILKGHLKNFDTSLSKMCDKLVGASLELHSFVVKSFLPSAVKFHYQFNLRDLSRLFEGLCRAKAEFYANPVTLCRLWLHEVYRIFDDRFIMEQDNSKFEEVATETSKKYFDDFSQDDLHAQPIIFTSWAVQTSGDEAIYLPVSDYTKLNKVMEEKLSEYNETNASMNLVLFEVAMNHVCRITRIIDMPRGNALLVGVGGSGKQSLARLAAFICEMDTFQVTISSNYGVNEFRQDLINLYTKTGAKSQPVAFLLTDGQIVDEQFNVYINDFLTNGDIPDLFTPEDKDGLSNSVRNEVKQAGIQDTKENLWNYFIEKVRKNLHLILCFSPVGDGFSNRARKFPAILGATQIDWFHAWPADALVSVANRFLADVDLEADDIRENISHHMAFVHNSAIESSASYLASDRRYNYATPKSFLELISLYKDLLASKRADVEQLKERLEIGLVKLLDTGEKVADLQVSLAQESVIVEEKKAKTDSLIEMVGHETNIAEEQKAYASEEESKAAVVAQNVAEFQAECEEDLKAAEPAIEAAIAALDSLDKKSLTELKSFTKPADDVMKVCEAMLVLTSPASGIKKDRSWGEAKKAMANVDRFLQDLLNFDKENVPVKNVEWLEANFMGDGNMVKEKIASKSGAAAGLCDWVRNIVIYFRIYEKVQPKREKLAEANEKLQEVNEKLGKIRADVAKLEARLADLGDQLEKATQEKLAVMAQAEKTQNKLNLAERLVNGLSGEKVRWSEDIEAFKKKAVSFIGDTLLAASFVSYIGAFNAKFRADLVRKWNDDIVTKEIPLTDGMTVLGVLTDEAEIAGWNNEGLPADPVSIENAAIIKASARWPLIIDPQLQGIAWLKQKEEANGLKVIQLGQPKYLDIISLAMENGHVIIIENISENIDAVLDPLLSRSFIKRAGKLYIKMGDNEKSFDDNFKLYLQTKLPNPHFKPEICAQATLINFTVTEKGLEEQLLGMVVKRERPDLEEQKAELLREQNGFKVTLKQLEDNLLFRLSNSQGDILEDVELVENLEETKKTVSEVNQKMKEAEITDKNIGLSREVYRAVGTRGALIYFLMNQLFVVSHYYQFSMAMFLIIMNKGMDKADIVEEADPNGPPAEAPDPTDVKARVNRLIDCVTFTLFKFVIRGMFENDKLIFSTQLCFRILAGQEEEFAYDLLDMLIRGPKNFGADNPLQEWLSDSSWCAVEAMKEHESFSQLPGDLESNAKRWKEWCEFETPEDPTKIKLPGDWKSVSGLEKLLIIRALRPDRITAALSIFIGDSIGKKYTEMVPFDLEESFQDSSPVVPIFMILSPGSDPVAPVEALGKKMDFSFANQKIAQVSLGQGQEPVAMRCLDNGYKSGTWVLLNNIHLVPRWCPLLEKKLDSLLEGAHPDFRVFLSAEFSLEMPVGLLQRSIKLTNEPPAGLQPNLKRAFLCFNDDTLENAPKVNEFKCILFALCLFHATIIERKKFGFQGWNRIYPFNVGDLTTCAQVLINFLENSNKIPWDDLKYNFGEIMYGGHITDDWDRRLCSTYLFFYMKEEIFDGMEYYAGLTAPPPLTFAKYLEFIDRMQPETPTAFGMHTNAEIGYRTKQGDALFRTIFELQPRDAGSGGGVSVAEKVKNVLDDVQEKIPEFFDFNEINEKLEGDPDPYTNVFLQEIEMMNRLLKEMKRSLDELDLGLKGDLTINDAMTVLMSALFEDRVPPEWVKLAWPSVRPLGSWLTNMVERVKQLQDWVSDMGLPKVTWVSGFFNPTSFLTAVMQITARKNEWPLDKMTIATDVQKKFKDEIDQPVRDGALIHGLYLEGGRWDVNGGALEESRLKELFYLMPVILVKPVPLDKFDPKDCYLCPVYKTQGRFMTYVFTANLKCKGQNAAAKWVLAGLAMIMDVVL